MSYKLHPTLLNSYPSNTLAISFSLVSPENVINMLFSALSGQPCQYSMAADTGS